MAKRVSIQGKGAEIFFGEYPRQSPPGAVAPPDEREQAASLSEEYEASPPPRSPAPPSEGASAPPGTPSREPSGGGVGERTRLRAGDGAPGGTGQPAGEPAKTRVFNLRGRAAEGVVRHSHDLYRDQVLWLNQFKLDAEVQYGQKLTGNDIVQLALDLLRHEYEALGEQSNLISVLVFGQPRRRVRARRAAGADSREDGPDRP